MSNKAILGCIILAVTSSVWAGAPYLGGGLGVGDRNSINLFGGYGARLGTKKNIYLAEEGFGSYSNANYYYHNVQLGFALQPGLYINDSTILYVRLGIVASRDVDYYGETNWSGQYGGGLQAELNKNWELRTEYVALSHNSFNCGYHDWWHNPRQFNVGVLYKFV